MVENTETCCRNMVAWYTYSCAGEKPPYAGKYGNLMPQYGSLVYSCTGEKPPYGGKYENMLPQYGSLVLCM
jgi:hypothetical protein